MKKIAIRFAIDEHDDVKSLAQHLQRFIIEDDYRISTISQKLRANERIVLDVGMEEKMPDFEEFAKELDEVKVEYELYKPVNGDWDKCTIEDLDLDRTPKWIQITIGLNILWMYLVIFLQMFYIYDWYRAKYAWGIFSSLVASAVTTLIPIYGSLVAYWSATELSHWKSYIALFTFFGYFLPLLGFILYLVWIVIKVLYRDKWYRFWRSEFN